MPFPLIPLLTAGIPALAGLFGGRKQQQQQSNTSTTNSSGTQSSSNVGYTNPLLSQNQRALSDTFVYDALNRFRQGPGDLSGITAGGLQQINQSGDTRRKIAENILASRGQSFSPSAAPLLTSIESGRIAEGNQFINQIPLIKRQLENENFQNLLTAFSALPTATESINNQTGSFNQTGTTNQQGTQLIPGNMLGGLFSGLGAGLLSPSGPGQGTNIEAILRALGIGKG